MFQFNITPTPCTITKLKLDMCINIDNAAYLVTLSRLAYYTYYKRKGTYVHITVYFLFYRIEVFKHHNYFHRGSSLTVEILKFT